VYRDGNAVIVRREDGGYEAVVWNLCGEEKQALELEITLPMEDGAVLVETVDGKDCNPLACWHEMGEPADLTDEQLQFLRAAGTPRCAAVSHEQGQDGLKAKITLDLNAVARVKILPAARTSDTGYDYGYYCGDK